MRILLGDRKGVVRAEVVRGRLSSVAWRLNKAGSATLTIARGDPAFRRELLEPGARIYADFDNGLPAWGGVLDTPREWAGHQLQIRCYTIERLLASVTTATTRSFYGVPAGAIFDAIFREADEKAALGITIGHVWYGGGGHWPRYHARTALWVLNQSIRKMEVCDYRIVPYLDGNKIRFRAELHEQVGDDKRTMTALVEAAPGVAGNVVGRPEISEQGEIVNRVIAVGTGATWGEREKVYGVERESQRRYGLREKVLAPQDVSQSTTLARYVENELRENAYPHTIGAMEVVNRMPALFADYDMGDILRVTLPSCGYDGYDAPMRLLARAFDPLSGRCQVVTGIARRHTPIIQGQDEYQPGEAD